MKKQAPICALFLMGIAVLFSCWPDKAMAQEKKQNTKAKNAVIIGEPVSCSGKEYETYLEISSIQAPEELIKRASEYIQTNKESNLCFPLYQSIVTAAIKMNNFEAAFEWGHRALGVYPDHMMVMTQLATVASNLQLTGNAQYAVEGEKLAHQALELVRSGVIPYGYEKEQWQPYRKGLLGDLYQSMGIFDLFNDCPENAAHNFMNSLEHLADQPYTYFLLAKAQVRLYQYGVREAIGPANLLTSNQPTTLLDQMIDTYAHALVLTEGERYQALRAAIEYDVNALSMALGPSMQTALTRSTESFRTQYNAGNNKP